MKKEILETVSELSEAEGTEDLDPKEGEGTEELDDESGKEGSELDEEGSGAEASAGDEEGFTIDLSDIPEQYQEALEGKLGEVEKYLHEQREKDSSTLRGLQETAKEYKALIENPEFRAWVLSQDKGAVKPKGDAKAQDLPKGDDKLFSSEGVETAFETSDGFAKYLNEGMDKLLGKLETTLSQALTPVYQREEDTLAAKEVEYMDKKYEGWRKNAADVLKLIERNDKLSLEDAYKITSFGADDKSEGAKATLKLVRNGKKKLIENEPESKDGLKGTEGGEGFTNIRAAVLSTVKELRSKES